MIPTQSYDHQKTSHTKRKEINSSFSILLYFSLLPSTTKVCMMETGFNFWWFFYGSEWDEWLSENQTFFGFFSNHFLFFFFPEIVVIMVTLFYLLFSTWKLLLRRVEQNAKKNLIKMTDRWRHPALIQPFLNLCSEKNLCFFIGKTSSQ